MDCRCELARPPLGAGPVDRARLVEPLNAVLERRVTLVSAPPGFGKTSLAAQWLALDPTDTSPEHCVLSLAAAVQGATEQRLVETDALLAARSAPPLEFLRKVFVAELVALDTPLVLVLEDYQAIVSDDPQKEYREGLSRGPRRAAVHTSGFTRGSEAGPRWRGIPRQ